MNAPKTYRNKPVEVQAMRLQWSTWSEMCDFAGVAPDGPRGCYIDAEGSKTESATDTIGLTIPTLEGETLAREGDWVIRGVKGEVYPIKDEIFRENYEAVAREANR